MSCSEAGNRWYHVSTPLQLQMPLNGVFIIEKEGHDLFHIPRTVAIHLASESETWHMHTVGRRRFLIAGGGPVVCPCSLKSSLKSDRPGSYMLPISLIISQNNQPCP